MRAWASSSSDAISSQAQARGSVRLMVVRLNSLNVAYSRLIRGGKERLATQGWWLLMVVMGSGEEWWI